MKIGYQSCLYYKSELRYPSGGKSIAHLELQLTLQNVNLVQVTYFLSRWATPGSYQYDAAPWSPQAGLYYFYLLQ